MAHLMKVKKAQLGGVSAHNERTFTNHSNQDIDPSRTAENYEISGNGKSIVENLHDLLDRPDIHCSRRKDINIAGNWVVTAPQDLRPADEKKFFGAVHEFLCMKYGQDAVLGANVHKDETTPHMHATIVPLAEDKRHGGRKVCWESVHTKSFLRDFHPDLSAHVEKILGYPVKIQTGETAEKGNKTIAELKKETKENADFLKKMRDQVSRYSDENREQKVTEMKKILAKNPESVVKLQSNFFGKNKVEVDPNFWHEMTKTLDYFDKKIMLLSEENAQTKKELSETKNEVNSLKKELNELNFVRELSHTDRTWLKEDLPQIVKGYEYDKEEWRKEKIRANYAKMKTGVYNKNEMKEVFGLDLSSELKKGIMKVEPSAWKSKKSNAALTKICNSLSKKISCGVQVGRPFSPDERPPVIGFCPQVGQKDDDYLSGIPWQMLNEFAKDEIRNKALQKYI